MNFIVYVTSVSNEWFVEWVTRASDTKTADRRGAKDSLVFTHDATTEYVSFWCSDIIDDSF